ncbi:MAG: protoporphyrinogen oxidase, partial [Cyanobacteria bacterium J06648_11]
MSDLTSFSDSTDAIIVGAGISGLTVAHRMKQLGYRAIVVERRDRVGGAIGTKHRDGYQWEEGPNSFTPNHPLLNLAADVGIGNRVVWADGKMPRFVYWDDRLLPVPMSPAAAITTQLLTLGGKLRVLRGLLGFVLSPPSREETVREFFTRQIGSQACDRLVAQFVSGVYAGDPDSLSASGAFGRITDLETKHNSLFAGIFREPRAPKPPLSPQIKPPQRGQLGTFKNGLQELPRAIADELGDTVKLLWQARSIERSEDGSYRVEFETPEGMQTLQGRSLVVTSPAYIAADLLQDLQPEASQMLRTIPYPHVAAVALGYPASALPQPFAGFGQLFPRDRGIRTLGTIWTSSLFPGRAPAGYHCLLSYIGGALDPDAADCSDAELAEAVHRDLSRTLLTRQV